MKKAIELLIALLISMPATFAQTYRDAWFISDLDSFASTWFTWGANGEGVYLFSHYRSLTYVSEDDNTIDTLICEMEHSNLREAKRDFKTILKFFRGMGPNEEWLVGKDRKEEEIVLYFENYDLYIGRVGRVVTFEFTQRQNEDRN